MLADTGDAKITPKRMHINEIAEKICVIIVQSNIMIKISLRRNALLTWG